MPRKVAETTEEEWARRAQTPSGQMVLDAARRVIARRGVHGASFPEIAGEAGQSHSLPSYYFGTKERLLLALIEADAQVHLEALRQTLRPASSFDELLAGMDRELRRFLNEGPGTYTVLAELASAALRSPTLHAAAGRARRRWRGELADILTEKARQGIVTLPIDAPATASLLTALAEGTAAEIAADPDARECLLVAAGETIRRLLEPPPRVRPETSSPRWPDPCDSPRSDHARPRG